MYPGLLAKFLTREYVFNMTKYRPQSLHTQNWLVWDTSSVMLQFVW
jgi:hypothetical protein